MCASEGSMEMERERVMFLKEIWGIQRMRRDGRKEGRGRMKRMGERGGDVRCFHGRFLGDEE